MRRKSVFSLASRLAKACCRQQGNLASTPVASAAKHSNWAAALGTRQLLAPLALPVPLPPPQQHLPHRSFSATTAAASVDAGLAGLRNCITVAAADECHNLPARKVPAFVREHLHEIAPDDIVPVIEQLIDLHFCEAEDDSTKPSSLAAPMTAIIETLLGEGSPLRADGEVVSRLLWAAYRLDLGAAGISRTGLREAAERSLDSCKDDGVGIAHTLCALGGLHLNPSPAFLKSVGECLGGGEVAKNMHIDYLILALQGGALLHTAPPSVLQPLLEELLKKSAEDGLEADEVGRIARFLPDLPPSEARNQLAAQMLSQAKELVPFLDVFGVSLVLRCAAKLGLQLEPDLLRALIKRAESQLAGGSAFHVSGPMLWSLGKLGYRVNDGIVPEAFVGACIGVHMANVMDLIERGSVEVPLRVPLRGAPISQALIDFLGGCNMLGVQLTEKALQAYADLIEMRQDFAFDEQELHTLLTHFKVMRSATGMNACKARLQIL